MAERRGKRDALRETGVDPYPSRFERTATAEELHAEFGGLEADTRTGRDVAVAGRVAAIRGHGGLVFVTLQDGSGAVQLLLSADRLDSASMAARERADLGDWIGARGEVITSRRGELSVDVTQLTLLAKALRPPPDKWHGLSDPDTRYRQREVDLLSNPESRRVFDIRFKTVASLRTSLSRLGFVEVETPVLQSLAGGAVARPFFTHANALDVELSLRIAPELYLKRLVIGGYERVFEISRNFRNEGIDTRHSPEFTSLEAYRAFGDFHDGMDLTEQLIVECADGATGRRSFSVGGQRVDLAGPWPRRPLLDLVEELAGRRLHPDDPVADVRRVCEDLSVPFEPLWSSGKLIFEIYDKVLMPRTIGPEFVWGFPVAVSPLARHNDDDAAMADRFELVINGREFANGYSELNVPEEQEERFRAEAKLAAEGDLEAHPADRAFVRALEYGLPPTSGIGIGVDRLVMLLAEVESIRDVILFPMMRPEAEE
jgi:lysyl-tRNA synthetase class 2